MAATATVPSALPDSRGSRGCAGHAVPARVVVVTATSGEEGVPRARLAPGESLAQRRVAELERACELLGVARLVLLGYADSGAHAGPWPAGSLGAAHAADVAARVAAVVEQE